MDKLDQIDQIDQEVDLDPEAFFKNNSMSQLTNIQKLQEKNIQIVYQYDSIYGKIKISNYAKQISEHPWFQRLKNIKQLGLLHFKFPHAGHSRFEHSLGVAHLARYVGEVLRAKHNISDVEILCLEIAGLCHDLGHGPYSHSFDYILEKVHFNGKTAHHEIRSQILIEHIIKSMELPFTDMEIKTIQYFIDPSKYLFTPLCEFTEGLEQIISNNLHKLDIDKMDYLLRDAQSIRFDLIIDNKLDIYGLLNRSQLVEQNNKKYWMFHIRDQGIVYDLICRRFIFYNNYYLHPEVNAINCMFADALKIVNLFYNFSDCVKFENLEDIENFIKLTDVYFLDLLLNTQDERLSEAKTLINNILEKNKLYKHLGDFITNVENIDDTEYTEIPWEIFTDKSTPTNLLPKVKYHQNGKYVNIQITPRRIYLKSFK